MATKSEGKVKWFDEKKGYGFISQSDGDDVFFHYSALEQSGFKTVEDETPVEFEMEEGPKGLKATSVNIVE
jgi:CspA family cold shock protein